MTGKDYIRPVFLHCMSINFTLMCLNVIRGQINPALHSCRWVIMKRVKSGHTLTKHDLYAIVAPYLQDPHTGKVMATNAERKETRLVARTSVEIQEIIQRAANYSGTTLSQFLIESAMEKARNVIERTEVLHLSMASADALFAALENPPKANNKLLKAAQHYKDTVNVHNH